ncbi:hypothetical protein ND748_00920 [Frankia sp. AiPs1]|uniref:hypothetical protein n=1 Tax=Frankia sp. AiPs1 TaxID=573493 RepID=UPI0020437B80|nr:hypothetical protein [Frankia sp. AiPs1]MCM3920251.1 hypothetical protein [Frankia sp. AiPs1]
MTIRLDVVPLPRMEVARTFVNTTSDNHVIQLSELLDIPLVRYVLARELLEIDAVRSRSTVSLQRGTPTFNRRNLLTAADRGPDRNPQASWEGLSRHELPDAVRRAGEERAAASSRTVAELAAEAATLPPGRYPRRKLMIGGGAALAGRDPDMLVVDSRGRWHVDPITAIVQSADQVRHLGPTGFGDPYQFAAPRERVPIDALRLWEHSAAVRGPVVDGQCHLSVDDHGRLLATVAPLDGSPALTVEVQGSPIVATGVPPEIIPGCSRQIPTLLEAQQLLSGHLTSLNRPELATVAGHLLAGPARAEDTLGLLRRPDVAEVLAQAGEGLVREALQTVRASAAWEHARGLAPGRVLYGDEVGNGRYNPFEVDHWLIAGIGGAALANAEIILQANPGARVSMVGSAAPWVLHNDAQYSALRRQHDAAHGGDGRLVTHPDRRLGHIEVARDVAGRTTFHAMGVHGDGYVACLGRVPRMPTAVDPLVTWARQRAGDVTGSLLFDVDRQYLGYRLDFQAGGVSRAVEVTGAASRMLPTEVFDAEASAHVAAAADRDVPAESGNVAAGFMATATQAVRYADHRAGERNTSPQARTSGGGRSFLRAAFPDRKPPSSTPRTNSPQVSPPQPSESRRQGPRL